MIPLSVEKLLFGKKHRAWNMPLSIIPLLVYQPLTVLKTIHAFLMWSKLLLVVTGCAELLAISYSETSKFY